MTITTSVKTLLASAFLTMSGLQLSAAKFEIEESFDDDAHFTQSAELPDGWARSSSAKFTRIDNESSNQTAKSGQYFLGQAAPFGGEVLYTPLIEAKGGAKFSIEFYTLIPGGNPPEIRNFGLKVYAGDTQDISSMTLIYTREPGNNTDWEKVCADFTPETDGNYCFAIELVTNLWGGGVYFDDFFFTGTEPGGDTPPEIVLEPNPEFLDICQELPYSENFSDPESFDGQSYLPIGWTTVGTQIWRTASVDDLPAQSGEWYMIAPESAYERDERAYTPFFNLQEGIEYTLSFESHFDGYIIAGEPRAATLDITVGTDQDFDFHSPSIYKVSRPLDETGTWTHEQLTFTPKVSGPYCFAFSLSGDAHCGYVAIDHVMIYSPIDTPRPEPDFYVKGIFDYVTSDLLAFPNTPARVLNTTKYGTDYNWEIPGATVVAHPDGSADLFFTSSGAYSLTLEASNQRSSRKASKTVNVTMTDTDAADKLLLAFDPNAIKLYQRGSVPAYDTDPNGLDYITGVNHYYRCLAERYDLPESGEFTLRKFNFYLTNLRYVPRTSTAEDQRLLPLTITLYGSDETGALDETKVLSRTVTTMGEMFDDRGFGSGAAQFKQYIFPDSPVVKGTVYLAFEFDEEFETEVEVEIVGRSFISINPYRHLHGESTTYAKPFAVPEGSLAAADGKWYPLNVIEPKCGGIGMYGHLVADYKNKVTSQDSIETAITNGLQIGFDGNTLTVVGLDEGAVVAVYDTNAQLMMRARAAGGTASADCSTLPSGVYLVSTPAGVAKFIK